MRRKSLLVFLLIVFAGLQQAWPDGGRMHRQSWSRPIPLGISGGNSRDFFVSGMSEYCCSGTLGAAVKNASGDMFILSNNHVLARDNKGRLGELITQPGLVDMNCESNPSQAVGKLSRVVRYRFSNQANYVDAALARALPGAVATSGRILDIGPPGPPVEAAIGMRVKKSGRTSGRTTGIVDALNVTALVEMPTHCGSSSSNRIRFVNQIYVRNATSVKFLRAGDSGSLLVQNKQACPGTVGLLYAGDDRGNGVANRIQDVLRILNVSIVGCGNPGLVPFQARMNKTMTDPNFIAASGVQSRHQETLLRLPGLIGVGIGGDATHPDKLAIVVFIKRGPQAAAAARAVPPQLESMTVRKVYTSGFVAF